MQTFQKYLRLREKNPNTKIAAKNAMEANFLSPRRTTHKITNVTANTIFAIPADLFTAALPIGELQIPTREKAKRIAYSSITSPHFPKRGRGIFRRRTKQSLVSRIRRRSKEKRGLRQAWSPISPIEGKHVMFGIAAIFQRLRPYPRLLVLRIHLRIDTIRSERSGFQTIRLHDVRSCFLNVAGIL